MSADQNNAPLDIDPAYELVNHEVYVPVFFTKLAQDYGIKPTNALEAQQMLSMSAQLRELADHEEKQAAAVGNPMLNYAQQHLNSVSQAHGMAAVQLQDQQIEKAAAEKALDPAVAHAILSLQVSRQ